MTSHFLTVKDRLHHAIQEQVFVVNRDEQIGYYPQPDTWIFDFRRVLMNGNFSAMVSGLFYEEFIKHYPFQIGTIEVAGVPLASNIMNRFYFSGQEDINAFFIRKSRKKSGLARRIEGEVLDGKEIILVDDLINTGDSFWRQVEVLEDAGYRVSTVWSVIRYRDIDYYKRFLDRGIEVRSLFTLNDFYDKAKKQLPLLSTRSEEQEFPTQSLGKPQWMFRSMNPNLYYVVPKSNPLIDGAYLYFGTDNGYFYCLNKETGTVVWKQSIGSFNLNKGIFSTPICDEHRVFFGAYDGSVYALDKNTGVVVWKNTFGDWVGSSPDLCRRRGIIYIGLEFGLVNKRGGIVALDVNSGKTLWSDFSHAALTHASPLYLPDTQEVVIGSNEGVMRLYDAYTGKRKWVQKTFGGINFDAKVHGGFGDGSIKGRACFFPERDYILFCAIDGYFYVLSRKTGVIIFSLQTEAGLWGTPCVFDGKAYFASLNKKIYCIDLLDFSVVWKRDLDHTRIFSSPVVHAGKIIIGTNSGRVYEVDPHNGHIVRQFQCLERVTGSVVGDIDMLYIPTFANEVIALNLSS